VALVSLTEHFARAWLQLNGYQSRQIQTSAGRVHVLDARGGGSLPPLVLLHGISSAGVHFLPLLFRLRGRVRRIVAPDLPAHGFSERPAVVNPELLKAGLVEAMDAVLDEPAVLFGNSMGGAAAVHYAVARRKNVRALVLASPGGAAMNGDELRQFVSTFAIDSHGDALAFVDRLLARRSCLRHLFAWGVRRQFAAPEVRSLLRALTPSDLLLPEHLASLSMPVLLLWGQGERILPRQHLDFFRRNLPGHARIEEPHGLGHAPHLDDPGAVARQILSFASSLA
jgi:pimeloyl-ACP methyl ester carboxylesterase